MTIQVHTNNAVQGSADLINTVQNQISNHLKRFEHLVNSVDVFLSDENAEKHSAKDKKCVIEVRVRGAASHAVTCQSDNMQLALGGAIDKMRSKLDSILERSRQR